MVTTTNTTSPTNDREFTFICSATGTPAPTIMGNLSDLSLVTALTNRTVTNSDHTTTVTVNITVVLSSGWSGDLKWQVNAGMLGAQNITHEIIGNSDEGVGTKGEYF